MMTYVTTNKFQQIIPHNVTFKMLNSNENFYAEARIASAHGWLPVGIKGLVLILCIAISN
jgi:hypothetical protein